MTTGLRPRPAVPAAIRAAIDAAVEAIIAAEQTSGPSSSWRFSGRWYSAHPIRTRSRPH